MPPARATSHDVARLAGVAQSTVSYALSGKGSVSAATRQRVLRAAQELNYRPNLAARAMRTRHSGRLAVVTGIPIHNPIRTLAGASNVAEAAGYAVEVYSINGSLEECSERVLDLVGSGQFDGVLCFVPVFPTVEASAPAEVPVVVSRSFSSDMQSTGDPADASPVAEFIERLTDLGHRRFLHVAGPAHYPSAVGRREAYTTTIERLGLESLGVVGGAWTGAAGVEAIAALPDDTPPLAVIAANDLVAVGVVRGATRRGWTVPGDVSVTGWDNYDVGPFLTPSLTTVDIDWTEDGKRAMRRLIALLRDEVPTTEPLPPLTRIIWRESTAAPRPSGGASP